MQIGGLVRPDADADAHPDAYPNRLPLQSTGKGMQDTVQRMSGSTQLIRWSFLS